MYKIIFLGSPNFSIPSLEAIFEDSRFEIVGVFSQPDKKIGRKQILKPSEIKKRALELELKVFTPKNINTPENLEMIQKLTPDFLFSFAYGQIISDEILAIPKIEPINLHTSLLPKYRGASPPQTSLLNGDTKTGITFIRMIDKMDAGEMFFKAEIQIEKKDNALTLFQKIAELSKKTTPDVLAKIAERKLKSTKQNEDEASYCKKINKQDGKINWENQTAEAIFNQIRAYTPWPGCFTKFEGKILKIIEADYKSQTSPSPSLVRRGTEQQEATQLIAPCATTPLITKERLGEVLQLNSQIHITTKSGTIIPKIIQLEGKKAMKVEDFIKGKPKLIGAKLGEQKN